MSRISLDPFCTFRISPPNWFLPWWGINFLRFCSFHVFPLCLLANRKFDTDRLCFPWLVDDIVSHFGTLNISLQIWKPLCFDAHRATPTIARRVCSSRLSHSVLHDLALVSYSVGITVTRACGSLSGGASLCHQFSYMSSCLRTSRGVQILLYILLYILQLCVLSS